VWPGSRRSHLQYFALNAQLISWPHVGLLTVENLGEMMMVQAALPKTYQASEKFFR